MNLATLLVILALVLLVVLLLRGSTRERFFNDQLSLTITWQPPSNYPTPQNLAYQWAVCNAPGCDPTQLSPITTSATQVVLNSSNCPGCDFGQVVTFAVRAVDTVTTLTSAWSTLAVNLTPTDTPAEADLYFEDDRTGQAPIVGTQGMFASFNATSDCTTGCTGNVMLTVNRGDDEYSIEAFSGPIVQGSGVSLDISFSNSAWTPSPPGPLQMQDVVTGYFLLSDSNAVMMYAVLPYTATAVAPGQVGGLGWAISS